MLPGDVEDEGEEDGGQHVEGDEAGLADPRHPVLVQVGAAHRLHTAYTDAIKRSIWWLGAEEKGCRLLSFSKYVSEHKFGEGGHLF